jgi:glycosyltransferase involved in cell wall biosynthesis
MKITVLASSYPRYHGDGVAPFVKSISESLSDKGHHVEVVAPYDIKVAQDPDAKIKVHRFKYIWPKKYHIMGHARSLQADIQLRPLVPFLLPLFIFFSIHKLLRVTKRINADVIHAHWVLPNGLSAAIVAKILNKPLVISLHGSDIFMADKNAIYRAVARWVFSQSAHVTACSRELFDRAKNINPNINVTLLAWGADPEKFKPLGDCKPIRKRCGWGVDETIIVALGRFVHKKGFDRLIEIAPYLSSNKYSLRIVIGGSGLLKETYVKKVQRLGLGDLISFPGQISWEEVPNFLAAADIFVLPSKRDSAGNLDGLPTVLLEAMACGLPCVASDVGGVSLVIDHGENGYLIDPESNKDLLESLSALIRNKALISKFSKQSRTKVVNQHNWSRVGKYFESIFLDAINNV